MDKLLTVVIHWNQASCLHVDRGAVLPPGQNTLYSHVHTPTPPIICIYSSAGTWDTT